MATWARDGRSSGMAGHRQRRASRRSTTSNTSSTGNMKTMPSRTLSRSGSLLRTSVRDGAAEVTMADLFFGNASAAATLSPTRKSMMSRNSSNGSFACQFLDTKTGQTTFIMDPPEYFDVPVNLHDKHRIRNQANNKKALVAEYWKAYACFPESWPWVQQARESQANFYAQLAGCVHGDYFSQREEWRQNAGPALDDGMLTFGMKPFVVMAPSRVGVRTRMTLDDDARSGDVLHPGECILVDSDVMLDGMRFLRLANTKDWVFERKADVEVMAPMIDMETGSWWYRIVCQDFAEIRRVPSFSNRVRTGCILCPGEVFVVSLRCVVEEVCWVKLADGRGWLFEDWPVLNEDHQLDWLEVACECAIDARDEDEDEETKVNQDGMGSKRRNYVVETGLWQYQLLHRALLAIGTVQLGVLLQESETVVIDKRVPANGQMAKELEDKTLRNRIWLRLADGRGWIPKTDEEGAQNVKFVGLVQGKKPKRLSPSILEEDPEAWRHRTTAGAPGRCRGLAARRGLRRPPSADRLRIC